jgi:predicted O-methyltransferase YrrM
MPEVARYETDSWRPELEGFSRDVLPFYHRVAQLLPMGARMVEVGTALGRSAIYMAERLVQKGDRDARIYCVDPWHDFAFNWWDRFLRSLMKNATAEERRLIRPLRVESGIASRMFVDGSLDFVFLDGSHEFEDVLPDVECWAPKLKGGGIFAGHDFDHPGVARVVGSLDKIEVADTCWWVKR